MAENKTKRTGASVESYLSAIEDQATRPGELESSMFATLTGTGLQFYRLL